MYCSTSHNRHAPLYLHTFMNQNASDCYIHIPVYACWNSLIWTSLSIYAIWFLRYGLWAFLLHHFYDVIGSNFVREAGHTILSQWHHRSDVINDIIETFRGRISGMNCRQARSMSFKSAHYLRTFHGQLRNDQLHQSCPWHKAAFWEQIYATLQIP